MKQLNIIGIMGTVLAIGFVIYVNIANQKKVVSTEKPISQIQQLDSMSSIMDSMLYIEQVDSYMDSVDMGCNGY